MDAEVHIMEHRNTPLREDSLSTMACPLIHDIINSLAVARGLWSGDVMDRSNTGFCVVTCILLVSNDYEFRPPYYTVL